MTDDDQERSLRQSLDEVGRRAVAPPDGPRKALTRARQRRRRTMGTVAVALVVAATTTVAVVRATGDDSRPDIATEGPEPSLTVVSTDTTTTEAPVSTTTPATIVPARVDHVAALMDDGRLLLLDADSGALQRQLQPSDDDLAPIDDLLTITAEGDVLFTTASPGCGGLYRQSIDAARPDAVRVLATNRVVASPDGAYLAFNDPADGCDDGPWEWEPPPRMDLSDLARFEAEQLAVMGIADLGVWAFSSQITDPRATADTVSDTVTARTTATYERYLYTQLADDPTGTVYRAEPFGSNAIGIELPPGHQGDQLQAAVEDQLLVLSVEGRLSRVGPQGYVFRLTESGVIDATWGPNFVSGIDGTAAEPVRPVEIVGAPGDQYDVEVTGWIEMRDGRARRTPLQTTEVQPDGSLRLRGTIPQFVSWRGDDNRYGFPPAEPLLAGTYELVQWDGERNVVVGLLTVTADGALPNVASPPIDPERAVLAADSLGGVPLAGDPATVEAGLVERFGEPDGIGDGIDGCTGYRDRSLGWGLLTVSFRWDEAYPDGQWLWWSYGEPYLPGPVDDERQLTTVDGIGIGATRDELFSVHSNVGLSSQYDGIRLDRWVTPGPADLTHPVLAGGLSADASDPTAVVTYLAGGRGGFIPGVTVC